jgi:LCP family protein required for cell wall assembly
MLERKSRKNSKPEKKKKNKVKIASISLIIIILIGAGAYIYRKEMAVLAFDLFLSGQVEETLEKSYAPIEGDEPKPVVEANQEIKPFSVLLLGVDQRENEPARSDTMIYSIIRPIDSKVLLLSIPRDTYTEIVGRDKEDKINHAYAFGGEKMAIDTVEKFLDSEVGYYAAINFEGLREVVDALGGVELPITKDIVNKEKAHEKFTIKANKPLYDGQEALNFVRYREDGADNRTKRHSVFLNAMVDRMLKLDQVGKIPELISMLGNNFKTNMTPSFIIELSKQVMLNQRPEINGFTIAAEGKRMHGIYYDIVKEADLNYAKQLIENWSDPNTKATELLNPLDRDKHEKNDETELGNKTKSQKSSTTSKTKS